ncbi:hypothetical protein M2G69_07530 [Vibrio vulnificus]|uniref:hypothetical protein n=1 Tax=Vibrio vulnificus TaxID=672 RepID=UPI001FAF0A7E|nr:hypothetical protein [Vibrio vulnificus]MCJ0802596.1 hypothetical protein [Vibrio vulnificus]MCU8406056.1 hypothetical protein [Vibrio vulnificus]HDY7524152.1 hypothetical protein [Vibrio vulnificus]
MKVKLLVGAFFCLFSTLSSAVYLDKMLQISDENGNASFIITNDKEMVYFVETKINEIVTTEDGGLIRKPYTRENLAEWTVAVSNPKFIIEPGRTKSLGIRAICGDSCSWDEDRTYEIVFIPKPYANNTESAEQSVNIFVGYAPVLVVPAKEPKVDYSIDVTGENLSIHNKGNTMLRVLIDNCQGVKESSCRVFYTLIKGRKKSFDLPKDLVNKDLNVTVLNHDESYRKKIIVPAKGY